MASDPKSTLARQAAWHELEYYAFIHFGPNTFTDEEWGRSQSPPDVFNPVVLDTDQWAKTFADAGMTGMILTPKHHDGMALWNTSTTTYKIDNGAWAKNRTALGIGTNVVRLAAASAKKYGINFGVYLSPWDIHRDPAMPKPGLAGTIYDEPQNFGDATDGDYNALYAAQLTELVTMALGDGSATFDWALFRDIIREHQPGAVMWGHQGVDARWVGNEDGVTVATNWHTISRTQDDARYGGEELQSGVRDGLYWTPAEADARIRDGWFWHASEAPKTAQALMDMYMQSVARSVNLLLDVPPDTDGVIQQVDVDSLVAFKGLRDAFIDREILTPGLNTTVSSIRDGDAALYGPVNVINNDTATYWAVDANETTGWVEIDLGGVYSVDAFIVQEHIALGQRIGGYTIEVAVDGTYQTAVNGTSLGYKRIDRLGTAVPATQIRFSVTQANATPLLQSVQILGEKAT
ncbi:hypothetical protein INS49_014223 [Diaporthe citri]|uniref:uncharacterized protein n=1 Tax=Diaporthe citri TaxID=83186 RepID=UPI001C7F3B2C|nr:uncharacterized protein INS49_014223 [Diaporthe citri]KAG6358339.1 hypothetical protein INS49_014223 [Diaporthe citri]